MTRVRSKRSRQRRFIETLENRRLLAFTAFVSDLPLANAVNGWGPIELDHSNGESQAGDGHTITLNGQGYSKGLGVHANSEVAVDIQSTTGYTNFQADIGVDDEVGANGSVVFQVWLDNNKLYDSGVMTGQSATKQVDISVANVTGRLRLIVTDSGNGRDFDHADWANARLIGTTPTQTTPSVGLITVTGLDPSEGGNPRTLSLSRGGTPISSPLVVNFTASGTATRGSDYELRTLAGDLISGNTMTIPANAQELEFNVVALQDTIVDPNETVILTLTPADTYTIGSNGSVTIHILDDDSPPANTTYLSDLPPIASTNGWGPAEHDRSNGELPAGDGKRITLNGVGYDKGIGAHAASDITYVLNKHFATFQTVVGVDDEVGNNGSVVFQVYADGNKIFDSGVRRGTDAGLPVSLDVTGINQLRLVVTNAGDGNTFDHADWADAKLILASSQPYSISMSNNSALEGTQSARIVVSVDGIASGPDPLSFDYETYDITATANKDYVPVSGHLTFQPGQSDFRDIFINLLSDKEAEANETFGIRIFNIVGNATIVPNGGIMEIRDNYLDKPVSLLTPTSQTNGWGPVERNMSNGETGAGDGRPMSLQGQHFSSGLGVHANSDITYNIASSGFNHFYSSVGVDDEVGNNGSVIFQAYVDGVKKFDSGVMTGSSATQFADVSVAGASTLRLVVTDAGNGNAFDHADWAGALLQP
jgi:hypothetical protein